MKDGFITVATATPTITVAQCDTNADAILDCISQMDAKGAKIMVLPELCITGYTCSDLFLQPTLLDAAEVALMKIARETAQIDALIMIGMPLRAQGKLYNVAAVLNRGAIAVSYTHLTLPTTPYV